MMRPVLDMMSLYLSSTGDPRDLHSFPTRRSSDLWLTVRWSGRRHGRVRHPRRQLPRRQVLALASTDRSEEHTSELQSQSNLVCRLLLEKKKQALVVPDAGPLHTPERVIRGQRTAH